MTDNNELFNTIEYHLINDDKPSQFINTLSETEEFLKYPMTMLEKLKSTEQSPTYHPEGNVWNHTMLVLDNAAKVKNKSSDIRVFMWAALLHDVGKADTTKVRRGRITSYDHDKVGAKLSEKFLNQFTNDSKFIKKVSSLVRWHMQILFVVKDMPFADIKSMKSQTSVKDVALLGLCDRLGRLTDEKQKEVEEENVRNFLIKCNSDFIGFLD